MNIVFRKSNDRDKSFLSEKVSESWGSDKVVSRGKIYIPADLPNIIAESDGKIIGMLTYHLASHELEVVVLESFIEGKGIGSGLLKEARRIALENNCKRIWLITTNDNTHALRFYQRNGFVIFGIYVNEIENSRKLKPQIPVIGIDGIPIRDEIELAINL